MAIILRLPSSGANGESATTTTTRAAEQQQLSTRRTFVVLLCLSLLSFLQQLQSFHSTYYWKVSPVDTLTAENLNTPVIVNGTRYDRVDIVTNIFGLHQWRFLPHTRAKQLTVVRDHFGVHEENAIYLPGRWYSSRK